MSQNVDPIVKVRADDTDESKTRNLWITFFLANIAVFLLAVFGPRSFTTEGTSPIKCPKTIYSDLGYTCADFEIDNNPVFAVKIADLTNLNQYLVLYGFPEKQQASTLLSDVEIDLEVSSFVVSHDDKPLQAIESKVERKIKFDCSNSKNYCKPSEISSVPNITAANYLFVVKITNPTELKGLPVSDFLVAFLYASDVYAGFFIFFRYVMVGVSLVSFAKYHSALGKTQANYLSPEQNQLYWIGLFTIFFNDPLYYFTYTMRSLITASIAILFIISFSVLLVYFWLSMTDKISHNGKSRSRCLNILLVILFYLAAFGTYGLLTYGSYNHPLVHFSNENSENFRSLKSLFFAVLGVIAVVLVFRNCRIFGKRSDLNGRDSLFFLFSSFFAVVYCCFLYTGTIEIYHDDKVRQILLYGLTNLYIYYMLHSYAPVGDGNIELVRLPVAQNDTSRMNESTTFDRVGHKDEEEGDDDEEEEDDDE